MLADSYEKDELRVLDQNGYRVFHRFAFDELGKPVVYEAHPEEPKKLHFA